METCFKTAANRQSHKANPPVRHETGGAGQVACDSRHFQIERLT